MRWMSSGDAADTAAAAPHAADTGTRPGLHGQTLVSMGLVDLDRLLGGGLPLGTLLLVLEVRCPCILHTASVC